jgi:preprotein translocase subunit YajC
LAQLILIVAMFALLWLFLIRPQRARAQAHRELLTRVNVGDEVLTVGGLYGSVIEIDDDDLMLEIAPGTQVRIARRAVAAVVPPDEEEEEMEEEEETADLEEGEVVLRDEEVRS